MWNPFAIFGKIFGSEKSLDTIVNGVSRGLDNLSYTEQEKSVDAAIERKEARNMILQWMATNSGSKLSRRYIAIVVTTIWAIEHIVATVLRVASNWVESPDKYLQSANDISQMSQEMNGAFILVLGYYFAAPYMGKMVEGAMNKLSGGIPKKVNKVASKKD